MDDAGYRLLVLDDLALRPTGGVLLNRPDAPLVDELEAAGARLPQVDRLALEALSCALTCCTGRFSVPLVQQHTCARNLTGAVFVKGWINLPGSQVEVFDGLLAVHQRVRQPIHLVK